VERRLASEASARIFHVDDDAGSLSNHFVMYEERGEAIELQCARISMT